MISKEDLLKLAEMAVKYQALEQGGVNNWEWYPESLQEYSQKYGYDYYEDPDVYYDIANDYLKKIDKK